MKMLIKPKTLGVCVGLFMLILAISGPGRAGSKAVDESAWLGVQLQALNDDLREALDMDEDAEGVLIAEVVDDSPADEAGLEEGDVVTAVDGKKVASVEDLVAAVRDRSPGDEIELEIVRDGRRKTITAELGRGGMEREVERVFGSWPGEVGAKARKWMQCWGGERGYLGVGILDLNDDLGQYFKVKEGEGVLITEVADDSPAEEAGLKAGDVVLEYDGKAVRDADEFREYVADTEPGEEVEIVVKRRGRKKTFEVEVGETESPIGYFMEPFQRPGKKHKCGKIVIKGDDGEIEVYSPGGGDWLICPRRAGEPPMPGCRMYLKGLEDLEDLEDLKELDLDDLYELKGLKEEIDDLQKDIEELRRQVEKLKK